MFRHSMSKCLDSVTATKDTCNNQFKLIAKNKLANVFGMNQSMAFAA